jgi:membrane protein implicated in regulation of membrane protease activity
VLVGDWVVWLVAAGAMLLAEIMTQTLVLGLLSAGAFVAAGTAALGVPLAGDLAVFAGVSALGFLLLRPIDRLHRRQPALLTGTALLEGRTAVVIEAVTEHTGRVKVGGESWAARSIDPATTAAVGESVVISSVDGATVVVYPKEL